MSHITKWRFLHLTSSTLLPIVGEVWTTSFIRLCGVCVCGVCVCEWCVWCDVWGCVCDVWRGCGVWRGKCICKKYKANTVSQTHRQEGEHNERKHYIHIAWHPHTHTPTPTPPPPHTHRQEGEHNERNHYILIAWHPHPHTPTPTPPPPHTHTRTQPIKTCSLRQCSLRARAR